MFKRNPIDWLARMGGGIAAAIMLFMTAHMLLEIILRNFFGTSTFVVDEFVGYGTLAMTFFALAYTLNHGGMIRVEAVSRKLKGRAMKSVELFAIAIMLVAFGGLAKYVYVAMRRNFVRGTTSESLAQIPLWIPQFIIVVGIAMLLLALIVRAVRVLKGRPLEIDHTGAA